MIPFLSPVFSPLLKSYAVFIKAIYWFYLIKRFDFMQFPHVLCCDPLADARSNQKAAAKLLPTAAFPT